MPRVAAIAVLALIVAPFLVAVSPLGESQDHVRDALVVDAGPQVARGAALFDRNCAVCHGDSGLGFAEAHLAFPEDHRRCTRCHKPNNPVVMSLEEVSTEGRVHDLFPVGDPPPLRGDGALASFNGPKALFHYTRATMPRYRPGTMTVAEYIDLTAFMLYVNGRLESAGEGGLDEADVGVVD